MVEFRRTLHTSSTAVAKRRALRASVWFSEMVQRLHAMPLLTRADLETAARAFFEELALDVDRPRNFDADRFEEEVRLNVDASRGRAKALLDQLRENQFDEKVRFTAARLAERAGAELEELSLPSHMPNNVANFLSLALRHIAVYWAEPQMGDR
jgi:8-oxo-dGTP pyrophosphatase MutT (NUDIX family)